MSFDTRIHAAGAMFVSLAVVLIGAASAAEPAGVRVPISKAADNSGAPLYVEDDAIRTAMPALADAGARRSTCASGMTIPPRLWLAFGPVVDGPHRARVTYVSCTFDDAESLRDATGSVSCEQPRNVSVGFIDEPARYFATYGPVDPTQAQAIAAAFFSGHLDYAPDVQHVDVSEARNITIEAFEGRLAIRWGDCGCSQSLRLQARDGGFIATRYGSMCV